MHSVVNESRVLLMDYNFDQGSKYLNTKEIAVFFLAEQESLVLSTIIRDMPTKSKSRALPKVKNSLLDPPDDRTLLMHVVN